VPQVGIGQFWWLHFGILDSEILLRNLLELELGRGVNKKKGEKKRKVSLRGKAQRKHGQRA